MTVYCSLYLLPVNQKIYRPSACRWLNGRASVSCAGGRGFESRPDQFSSRKNKASKDKPGPKWLEQKPGPKNKGKPGPK